MDELKFTAQDVLIEPLINDLYNFSELFLRINYDGTILDFTANSSHELYIPGNYFIGRRVRDILPEKVVQRFDDAVYQVLRRNTVKIFEYSVIVNNNQKFYKAKFFPSVNKQVIVIINEITNSKNAVKAYKESESKFRSIWENSRDGMRLINSKGIIVSVNNAFCKMFEMEEQELIGKPFNVVYRKQKIGNIDESPKLFQQRFSTHSFESFLELKVDLKTGGTLFLEIVNTFIEGHISNSLEEKESLLLSIFRDITERKKSEQTRASMAAIVDSSNDAIIGCTLKGIIVNWNKAAESLYGYSTKTMKGHSFLRIFPQIGSRKFREILDKIKQDELLEHYEAVSLKKDGSDFYTSVTISPIKNSDGAVTGFSAIVRDITERKKSEEILKESEERYRTLIETSPDAIALFDLNGNMIMGNIQVARTFGFHSTTEFNSQNIINLVGEDNRKKVLIDSKELFERGTLKNVQYMLFKKSGTGFYGEVSASLVHDAAGNPSAVICIFRDITERVEADQALKRSEEQFRSVWENSNEGMRLSDQTGKILAVNEAFCKLTGLTESEIIGKYFYELYNETSAVEKDRYSRIFTDPARRKYQSQFTFISGKVLDLDITYSIISYTKSPVLLSIFHDVTEAKRSERELRKTEKLAAIGKMAAYLAHEIKTPLASIKINIDMLTQSLDLPKSTKRSFVIIQKEVKRLHNLLKNVLQFSRQVDLVFMDINLCNLINGIKVLFHPVFSQYQISFINKVPDNIIITGDSQKLITVFSHLIENAVEALPKRGRIEIYTNCIYEKNLIEIFVKDSGSGIKQSIHIFEPFFTTKNSGTGLGLSIAQKVIEQHDGTIDIHSSVPGETIFRIVLNLSRSKHGYNSNHR